MAWFPCNIGGGGPSEIANILKGTSDPTSSIGDNGQLYLKYGGSDTRYTYSETLGGYVLNDYFYSEANQFIGTVGGRGYSKYSNGAAIAVIWKNSTYSGPLLISTVESNIFYSYNASGSLGSATIDGITWYLSTTNYWSNPVESAAAPIIEADYYPTASSRLQEAIEDILEASDFKTSLPTNVVNASFAKVNGQWQNLIGTNIDDILAGGSKYIKTTGSFTSASSGGQKVEVNCGFKPDLVMVDMEFGNGFTRATYLSTAWYEETDHPASVWDLRPMENVIYAIVPESVNGETGITDLTDTGFKYRSNGSNTTNKACTYTAIKFDVEEQTEDKTYLFKDGEWKNQDILSLYGYNTTIENGSLKCTGAHAGVVVDDVSGLDSSVTQYSVYLKVRAGNVNSCPLQTGRNVPTQNLYDIIQYGTDRYSYNTDYISSGTDYLFVLIALYNTDGVFLGAQNSDENAYYYIDEIWLEASAYVIVHS